MTPPYCFILSYKYFVTLSKKAKVLLPLGRMFRELINTAEDREITDILEDILEQTERYFAS